MNKRAITPEQIEPQVEESQDYTIEGLMNDFPTATELEQFVYTQTGGATSLKLRGRSNEIKYRVALDALLGRPVEKKYLTDENPYLEKTELVPMEELKATPARHQDCPEEFTELTRFNTSRLPHPEAGEASQGHTCDAIFKSYKDGTITYEIIGPVNQRPEGHRLNKWGQSQPALIRWIDPRTGEQILRYPNGTFTPVGKVLHEKLTRLDGMNVWNRYIDRTLTSIGDKSLVNPWNQV